jgi:hypothetical protein
MRAKVRNRSALVAGYEKIEHVLVEHVGKSLGILGPHAPQQIKSKQYLPQYWNGVLEELGD